MRLALKGRAPFKGTDLIIVLACGEDWECRIQNVDV